MPHSIDDSSLIFQTPNGRVVRCACCGRLEVAFGNIVLAGDSAGLLRFRRIVAQLDPDASPERIGHARPFRLSVQGTKLAFRFTHDEAAELRDLLDGAAAMLELECMLDDVLRP